MAVSVYSYTIYHSPNAYLGTVLQRRALSDLPGVALVRRPIYVPRERGLMIAGLLGGKENKNAGSYNREDCRRWSERCAILMSYRNPGVFHKRAQRWAASPLHREELPARVLCRNTRQPRPGLVRGSIGSPIFAAPKVPVIKLSCKCHSLVIVQSYQRPT